MNKTILTAPCGLDCFNCGVYEGNITTEIRKRYYEGKFEVGKGAVLENDKT
jgi:hypothetical protein